MNSSSFQSPRLAVREPVATFVFDVRQIAFVLNESDTANETSNVTETYATL